jgi:hypothetical protein
MYADVARLRIAYFPCGPNKRNVMLRTGVFALGPVRVVTIPECCQCHHMTRVAWGGVLWGFGNIIGFIATGQCAPEFCISRLQDAIVIHFQGMCKYPT